MDEQFFVLIALLIQKAVAVNGGPLEFTMEEIMRFDPFKWRIDRWSNMENESVMINFRSAQIIEGEIVAD